MSRSVKSQWEFGELFPPESARRVLTVSELTGRIKGLLEQQVGTVWVSGEVSNLRVQSSGHMYFTLRDAWAHLSCVLFRGEPVAHRDLLQDGQQVLLQGDLTVYAARGQYQLVVRAVEYHGLGALQIALERLKQKLAAEGLFAPERKRPLPRFPRCIGLVTSPTGAALRDVLRVLRGRHAGLEIVLAACRVQGEGAAAEIAAAIGLLNEFAAQPGPTRPELILVTRGGGSLEDLWAFNGEIVARAVFESALPVVSAIGHEIDYTICDFVADVRAPTPSAAATLLTEAVSASREFVLAAPQRLRQCVAQRWRRIIEDWQVLWPRWMRAHPRRRLQEAWQRLDELQLALTRGLSRGVRTRLLTWQNLAGLLVRLRPTLVLQARHDALQARRQRLEDLVCRQLRDRQQQLHTLETRLRLLGPEQVLARGYSITTDAETGRIVRRAAETQAGQRVRTRLHEGEILSRVESFQPPRT